MQNLRKMKQEMHEMATGKVCFLKFVMCFSSHPTSCPGPIWFNEIWFNIGYFFY